MYPPLYYSSAIMGALILIASLTYYSAELAILYQITYTGIITSILNHMGNNDIAIYADRTTIVLATFIYIYYTFFIKSKPIKIIVFILLVIAITCFFLSKFAIAILSFDNKLSPDNPRTSTLVPSSGVGVDHVYLSYDATLIPQHLHMTSHILAAVIFIMIVYDYSSQQRI